MPVSVEYANPSDTALVNYHFDADSMTVLPVGHQLVKSFIAGGGAIQPYIAPPLPPTQDQLDLAALNDALMQPGSVVRAILKTIFNHENRIRALEGKAAITQAQFVTALQAVIR